MQKIDKTYKGYSRWLLGVFAKRDAKLKKERAKKVGKELHGIVAITYEKRKAICKKGADLLPGDYYVVPVGQTLDAVLYESGDQQYLTTCITDKFFFFIPYKYAEYVVEFKGKPFNFDTFNGDGVADIIYECENWNKRGKYTMYSNSGSVSFGKDGSWEEYELGNNDYQYMKEVGASTEGTQTGTVTPTEGPDVITGSGESIEDSGEEF